MASHHSSLRENSRVLKTVLLTARVFIAKEPEGIQGGIIAQASGERALSNETNGGVSSAPLRRQARVPPPVFFVFLSRLFLSLPKRAGARAHAHTHARTHACTHAHTHTHT